MTCPDCQAANLVGSLFCVACARPLAGVAGLPLAATPGPLPVGLGCAPVAVAVAPAPPAVAAARTLRLVALENLQPTGLVLTLPDTTYQGTLFLGRTDLAAGTVVDVDLTVAGGREKRVSRRHARLAYQGGLVSAGDWESAHGTWVNKQRLAAGDAAVLADGDELRLADFVFRVDLR